MPTDAYYELAFALRRERPWKNLYDSQIFAVRHSDGQLSYCCVMGHSGEHLALAIYCGEAGLHTLHNLCIERFMLLEPYLQHEMMLSQDCLMVSFQSKAELPEHALDEVNAYCQAHGLRLRGANAYPVFERFRPHYLPWRIEGETDLLHLREGMEAALEVSRRLKTQSPEALGLMQGDPDGRSIPLLVRQEDGFAWQSLACADTWQPTHARALLTDELAIARARQAKKCAITWGLAIVMHGEPCAPQGTPEGEEPQSAPFFPYVLLVVSLESGLALSATPASDPEDYAPEFTQALLKLLAESGRPLKMLCKDTRTLVFLQELADRIGIPIEQQDSIDALDEVLDHYVDAFSSILDDGLDDDEDNPYSEEEIDAQSLALLRTMLTNPEALHSLPDHLLRELGDVADAGVLPFELCQIIRAEIGRRRKR